MIINIQNVWKYRELLIALTKREIRIRYKQTVLGSLWAILQPLSLALIFAFIFGFILEIKVSNMPYIVFTYSALLPWTFFSNALTFGSLSVVNNGNLVTKVYFPREILPFSSIGAASFDFLVATLIFLALIIYYKIDLTYNLLFLIIIIPSILLLTAGFSLLSSAINVMYRDVKFVIPLMLQIWMYLTPIIYSSEQVPNKFKFIFYLNPLTFLIESFRKVTIYGMQPKVIEVFYFTLSSIFIFVIGYLFFKKQEKIFADVI